MIAEAPIIETSPWTPGLITALFGGLALLTGALVTGVVKILAQLNSNKLAGEAAGNTRDAKLDQIRILVDGPVSDQLRQIADLLSEKADVSGKHSDHVMAEDARKKSDQKDAQVAAVESSENK